jgi:hypothetical protein
MEFFKTTSYAVFCTAWVREVLYKSLNLLAAICSNIVIVDIKMGLFLQVLTVLVITVSLQGWLPLRCLEEERIALLHLKDSLNYPNGTSLPSWIEADAHCCSWERINCNSSTGRVTMLDLWSVRNWEIGT